MEKAQLLRTLPAIDKVLKSATTRALKERWLGRLVDDAAQSLGGPRLRSRCEHRSLDFEALEQLECAVEGDEPHAPLLPQVGAPGRQLVLLLVVVAARQVDLDALAVAQRPVDIALTGLQLVDQARHRADGERVIDVDVAGQEGQGIE